MQKNVDFTLREMETLRRSFLKVFSFWNNFKLTKKFLRIVRFLYTLHEAYLLLINHTVFTKFFFIFKIKKIFNYKIFIKV